ncbi:MAG: tRNA 2-thiouridine(34) synthase MnmA [Oscillospiraceae bacterium]|nr:tRNA 2-thiouridine(34) synthase MnmA [Oscillospiraceae bacterium]
MDKVLVGMSGGVDSAVAALLLKKAGYEVAGVTLRTWEAGEDSDSRCCDIDDAKSAARQIGIDHFTVNCTQDFRKYVVDPFAREYIRGMTPNPCIECNRYVKWDRMMMYAKVVGAKYVATGHYASVVRLDNGRYTVRRAAHSEKDQTYMLYKLTQEQLAATLMPLGGLSKEEVRRIAADAGLPVASKPDSQEVCFVTDGSYADYIEKTAAPDAAGEGNFVDESGNVLGRHRGIIRYTVGQRKGLGIALGHPAYVKEIRAETREVVLGDERSLYRSELLCGDLNFMSIPVIEAGGSVSCSVRIRYRHEGQKAVVAMLDDGTARISFDEPVRAATPGQSAVFYDECGNVIGGGIISRVL